MRAERAAGNRPALARQHVREAREEVRNSGVPEPQVGELCRRARARQQVGAVREGLVERPALERIGAAIPEAQKVGQRREQRRGVAHAQPGGNGGEQAPHEEREQKPGRGDETRVRERPLLDLEYLVVHQHGDVRQVGVVDQPEHRRQSRRGRRGGPRPAPAPAPAPARARAPVVTGFGQIVDARQQREGGHDDPGSRSGVRVEPQRRAARLGGHRAEHFAVREDRVVEDDE